MTEKRFRVEKQTFDGYCITDNHFKGYYAYEKQDLEKLCENLNDLSEENEQLKKSVKRQQSSNNECAKLIEEQQKENEQLKEENNKIKSLLFQKIKELNDGYQKSAKAGIPTGGIIGELDSFEEICEEMGWLK